MCHVWGPLERSSRDLKHPSAIVAVVEHWVEKGRPYIRSEPLNSESLAIRGINLACDHETPPNLLVGFNNNHWQTRIDVDRGLG